LLCVVLLAVVFLSGLAVHLLNLPMLITALILAPLVAAIAVAFLPASNARPIALLGTLANLAIAIALAGQFDFSKAGDFQLAASAPFLPQLGINLSVAIDGIGLLMILLTALLGPLCVLCSTTAITDRKQTFYAWLLALQAAMVGVFAARDLVLFYVCFEFTLVPMFILINLFGSTNRKRAAVKFFLYTFTGSIIALAGLVYVAAQHASEAQLAFEATMAANAPRPESFWNFSIDALADTARAMSPKQQGWVLLALLAGFAVKVPLFPVHTWLPLAHTEAPTAGSVVLAGVLLKLGTYAIFRFVLPFVPDAVAAYAPLLAVLCIIGILYGGLICWVQTDIKKLVAYSSVAHLGFCMLGMFSLNSTGITGSVLYMVNHGLSTGALFLLIGMMYERYHTRNMKEIGGLATKMPVWATFMVFFTMASVGLPGLNGFVSEFMCMMGAFQASSAWGSGLWNSSGGGPLPGSTPGNLGAWYGLVAGTGVIIAAMYLLIMLGKVVWGPLREPAGHASHGHESHGHDSHGHDAHAHGSLPVDLNTREIVTLAPLALLCFVLGVYPKPMIELIDAPVQRTVAILEPSLHRMPSEMPEPAPQPGSQAAPAHSDASQHSPAPSPTAPSSTAPSSTGGHP
jgi:NADH-quinone oxidoreductase subunit M